MLAARELFRRCAKCLDFSYAANIPRPPDNPSAEARCSNWQSCGGVDQEGSETEACRCPNDCSGAEDQFPPPRASVQCRFSQRTFAGTRGNGREAPIPAVPRTAIEPPESTHSGPSAAPGLPRCLPLAIPAGNGCSVRRKFRHRDRPAPDKVTGHSSGTPALRRPRKNVASDKARIFGIP